MAILQDDAILDDLPAKTGAKVYATLGEFLHDDDLYRVAKERSNEIAEQLFPELIEKVQTATDQLKVAAQVAIVGNLIDLGVGHSYNLDAELNRLQLAIDDFEDLRAELSVAEHLLYIGDNAGEIYFDRVFVEAIHEAFPGIDIAFSVRAGPIINDATYEDAKRAGIDRVARIVEGTQSPGLILDEATPEFKRTYIAADIIIAKGQGNFEALSERPKADNLYFMLKAKCTIIEQYFGVPPGASILSKWQKFGIITG
jgi:hypothetical protein